MKPLEIRRQNIGKLNQYPKEERDAKRKQREIIDHKINILNAQIKAKQKLLEKQGNLNLLIASLKKKIRDNALLAKLKEDDVIALFEQQNGFFSFDKGHEESQLHQQYRPLMNLAIQRFYARQALEYYQREYGDNAELIVKQKALEIENRI